jgi:hypothetical protein
MKQKEFYVYGEEKRRKGGIEVSIPLRRALEWRLRMKSTVCKWLTGNSIILSLQF